MERPSASRTAATGYPNAPFASEYVDLGERTHRYHARNAVLVCVTVRGSLVHEVSQGDIGDKDLASLRFRDLREISCPIRKMLASKTRVGVKTTTVQFVRETSPVRLERAGGTMVEAELRRPRAVAFGRGELSRFVRRTTVLSAADIVRAIKRMAHEIIERNSGLEDVVLIGLERGGVPIARALSDSLTLIEEQHVPVGSVDASFHRDDISTIHVLPEVTRIPFSVTDRNVILCDDVLFTGRTVRAALDAVTDFGRPRSIQLAVMVDRGHRELPIRPDYIGKNLPTSREESVRVTLEGVELGTREPLQTGTREGDS